MQNEHAPIGAEELALLKPDPGMADDTPVYMEAGELRSLLTLAERGLAAGAGETDEEMARAIMDNACLPASLASVDAALRRDIAAALATARASERERCAKIAEMRDEIGAQIWPDGHDIAAAIREDKKEGA